MHTTFSFRSFFLDNQTCSFDDYSRTAVLLPNWLREHGDASTSFLCVATSMIIHCLCHSPYSVCCWHGCQLAASNMLRRRLC